MCFSSRGFWRLFRVLASLRGLTLEPFLSEGPMTNDKPKGPKNNCAEFLSIVGLFRITRSLPSAPADTGRFPQGWQSSSHRDSRWDGGGVTGFAAWLHLASNLCHPHIQEFLPSIPPEPALILLHPFSSHLPCSGMRVCQNNCSRGISPAVLALCREKRILQSSSRWD